MEREDYVSYFNGESSISSRKEIVIKPSNSHPFQPFNIESIDMQPFQLDFEVLLKKRSRRGLVVMVCVWVQSY